MFLIVVHRAVEDKASSGNISRAFYNRITQMPGNDYVPLTFIFGGKMAPGYYMARLIIKLINSVKEYCEDIRKVKPVKIDQPAR